MNNDTQIFSVGGDNSGALFDINTQIKVKEFSGHNASIKCIAKCEEKGIIATGGRDG